VGELGMMGFHANLLNRLDGGVKKDVYEDIEDANMVLDKVQEIHENQRAEKEG